MSWYSNRFPIRSGGNAHDTGKIMITDMKQVDGVHIATLGGDIDGRSAPQIQETLLPLVSENCKILLDMSHVTYMSSAGLRILLLLYRQIADNAGRVVLVGLPEKIWDTMSITGFLDFFEAYGTMAEGMAALQAPQEAAK